ncbi:AAA family ATPase [Candidatus Woesearchaeota archaeon]|nr:AAA family ATPase [Candidatus Woesearchaeota archaeon]
MNNELTYEELKLGEQARDAFLSGASIENINGKYPIYLNTNTRGGIAGLNTTDLAIAGILAGIPVLLGGRYGTGKSQLASDIYSYYFNGPKLNDGEAVRIDVNPSTDILDPTQNIYTKYSIENQNGQLLPKIELSQNVRALFHFIDEINRTPTQKQNQFYPQLNGHITHEGQDHEIGHDDYRAIIATANLGNGLYTGTFDFDPALKNRFGICIDTNYSMFEPTEDDRGLISLITEANPGIKSAPKRDITKKIIEANRQIRQNSLNLDIYDQAVLWYLEEGLRTCRKNEAKEAENWFEECRECSNNPENPENNPALCSLIGSPVQRTLQATRKYAVALSYLARLKNPQVEIDGTDLMFKAFELTSAYQPFLNPDIEEKYRGHRGKMMADINSKLKEDFMENQKYIIAELDHARNGEKAIFIEPDKKLEKILKMNDNSYHGGTLVLPKEIYDKLKDNCEIVDPFSSQRNIGLSWVRTRSKLLKERAKSGSKK